MFSNSKHIFSYPYSQKRQTVLAERAQDLQTTHTAIILEAIKDWHKEKTANYLKIKV